ncbi:MAG TPA: UDP-glucose 4-epimerase GalE [Sporichthyaceae bacterium]|nr:UDP-glucose 4-epimerase GalE [Sporichthyaceae bacterium]
MTWLLTGGAGYIGGHVVRAMLEDGSAVVVLDDLSTGLRQRVPRSVPFVQADVRDRALLCDTLREHRVTGVIHLAAKKSVPESVTRPIHYYEENVGGFVALLAAMQDSAVNRLVLSSSAAVLGTPPDGPVDEDAVARPENPYGRTKLICEWLLADAAVAHGIQFVSLRYFNVAGAAEARYGDVGESNLIPMVFRALSSGVRPKVFGGDWPTPDGSCVRDFIHVADLALAHVAAARRLDRTAEADEGDCRLTLNVGRGEGVSVRQVMATVAEVTGREIAYELVGRRPGDPASVVGTADRIAAELSWKAERDLHDMVRSAWEGWADHGAA